MKKQQIITLIFSFFTVFLFGQFPIVGNLGMPGGFGGFGASIGGEGQNFKAPEDWIPDSVPLRIVKFVQTLADFYEPVKVDTSFYHFELLRGGEKFNDVWLGNVAYGWLPNEFDKRIAYRYQDFYFLNQYLDKLYIPANKFYYRTNRPYTDLYYVTAPQNREQQLIEAIHTQNINYYTNFGVMYKISTAKEYFAHTSENSSIGALLFWLNRDGKKYRYSLNAFLNTIKILEIGGIVDTPEFNPLADIVDIYLTNAQSRLGYRGFTFDPEYFFVNTDSLKFSLQLGAGYSRHTHAYYDPQPYEAADFYGRFYMDTSFVFDSVAYDLTFGNLKAKFKFNSVRGFGQIGFEAQNFYYFRGFIFKPRGIIKQNYFTGFSVENISIFKGLNLNFSLKYYFLGRKAGQTSVVAQAVYQNNWLNLGLESNYFRQAPDYFYTIYVGNLDKWINGFDFQIFWKNQIYLQIPKYNFDLSAQYWLVDKYIYFKHLAEPLPYQVDTTAVVGLIRMLKSFNLWFLHLDAKVVWQYTNHNELFNLPTLMTYSSLWIDFYLFKRAMYLNLGTDLFWNSGFVRYKYWPSVQAFYFERYGQMTGKVPILNVFLNVKVKRMSFFVRLEYVNSFYDDIPYYASVDHYHLPELYFRWGARWWFKN